VYIVKEVFQKIHEINNCGQDSLLEKQIVAQLIKKFPTFMATRGSLPCQKSSPLVPILNQIHPVHNFSLYLS